MEFEQKISVLKNPDEYFNDLIEKNIINKTTYINNERKYSGATLLYNIIRQLLIDNKEDEVDKILEKTNFHEQHSFFKETLLFQFVSAELEEYYEVFFYLYAKGIDFSKQNREGDSVFHKLVDNFEEKNIDETINFIQKFDLSLFEIKNKNDVMPIDKVYPFISESELLKEKFYMLKNIEIEKKEINKIIEKNEGNHYSLNKKRL